MDESGALRQTIQDFLSDGSLAQVCAELSEILGTPVELRDREGRRIVAGDDPPWRTIEDGPDAPPDATRIPIEVEGRAVGSFHLVEHALQPAVAQAVVRALGWLAKTAGEICAHDLEIRRQLKEIDVLQRLSAMLVRAGNVTGIVETALDSALDVLGLDAGSVVVFPEEAMTREDEGDLQLVASRHLSQKWLQDPIPLSHNREFDRRALKGEIVTVEDIQVDDRIAVRDEAREEGLGS
ncbi:MAG: hypothetical protein KDA28_09930, partial [Phycisphaerales bacterium]|nr:hypothetical protein [Phycisphaerales bacterium]